MALTRQFSKDGVDYPEAYSRITSIRCDKSDAYVFVCTYATEGARFAGEFPVHAEELMSSLSILEGTVFPGAYEFVKGCPGFEGATDHLAVEGVIEVDPSVVN
jgi:hypothetical protein